MNILMINILIFFLHLSILVYIITAADLGVSSCRYLGEVDPANKRCHVDAVKLNKISAPCTAFVYDGVTCDENYLIGPSRDPMGIDIIKNLVDFSPNVFLYYGYKDIQAWSKALENETDFKEVPNIRNFVTEFPVGGLILKNMDYDYTITQDFHIPAHFFVHVYNYVKAIKTAIPDFKIGLYVKATGMMFYDNNRTSSDWFDFTTLNEVMDYYVIGFDNFNLCTDEFLNGGIVPLDPPNPTVLIYTLYKFKIALNGSAIAKDKVYFEFSVNPTLKAEAEEEFIPCEISYNEYCENPNYKEFMCVDNQDTFFEKGKFTKENSKGFIAKYIDLIDRDLKCECNDDKYVTFTMILNGYNNLEKVTCAKLSGS